MAKKKEDKKPKSIDDILNGLKGKHTKDLDAAFKAHDEFTKDETQNHFYNNIINPAQDELYKTIKSELDKSFDNDEAKLHKKKDEIKKAVTAGLKKYFSKSQPSLTKIIKDLGIDESDQYDFLTSMYDEQVGAGKIKGINSIRGLEGFAKDKKATVGHMKKLVYDQKSKHAEGTQQVLVNKHVNHHFQKFHPTEIAAYLKPQIEKAGFEIEDKVAYATAELGEHLQLRGSLLQGKSYEPMLKKKKEDKKKK